MPVDIREDFYHSRIREAGPHYEGFDLSTTDAILNLLFTYDLLHQCQARYMTPYGLSKSTVNILMALRHGPANGMLLHDLGELLLVSRANITGLMDSLEERGYVNRVVDEGDRRGRLARITPKAEALLDTFMPIHNGHSVELLRDLSGDDKRELARLLKKMRESIRSHMEACAEGRAESDRQ